MCFGSLRNVIWIQGWCRPNSQQATCRLWDVFVVSDSVRSKRSSTLNSSVPVSPPSPQMSSKRSSSFRRAIANGRRTLQREILLDETGLGLYKRFVRYVAYEILPCETDRRWYFHQNRLCPPPVFIAIITIVQVSSPCQRNAVAGCAISTDSSKSFYWLFPIKSRTIFFLH